MAGWGNEQPTVKQLNYAHELAEQLGVEDKYSWLATNWTKREISALIDDFKKQLGYD